MSAVTFGKRERYRFSTRESLKQLASVSGPAIYAATYKQDPANRPTAHSIVYFGETGDMYKDALSIERDLKSWWRDNGGTSELFIFFHPMPDSSQYERATLQHKLVLEYDPHGNH